MVQTNSPEHRNYAVLGLFSTWMGVGWVDLLIYGLCNGMGFENIYLHLICVHVNKFKIGLIWNTYLNREKDDKPKIVL